MEYPLDRLSSLLDKYMEYFPEEQHSIQKFRMFQRAHSGTELYDRKNFTGHVTVSAIIADRHMEKFLLLGHRQLNKWLQPGGHAEPGDGSLLVGAMREVEEETGLSRDEYDVMATPDGFLLLDIDSHRIPASENKHEGEHYHHDVRFLFRLHTPAGMNIKLDAMESTDYRWVTRTEFPGYFGNARIIPKLELFSVPLSQS